MSVSENRRGALSGHCHPPKALEWCLTHSKPNIKARYYFYGIFVVIVIVIKFLFSLSPSQETQHDDEKG